MNSPGDGTPSPAATTATHDDHDAQPPAPPLPANAADETPSPTPTTTISDTDTPNGHDGQPPANTPPAAAPDVADTPTADAVAPLTDKDEPEIGPQPATHAIKEEGEVALDHVDTQMELLERGPDDILFENGAIADGEQHWQPDMEHELKRVKVYELVGTNWADQGTAFCFGQFSEESNEALLIARSEKNYNDVVLSVPIRGNDVYQRQQETLIVWTEPDGVDYALSFQDAEGCSEVWNFIMEVQRHLSTADNISTVSSSPLLNADMSVTTESIYRYGQLPEPRFGIIGEIERAIKTLTRTPLLKERICEYIQQEDYIKQLIDVMVSAEDLESLENLHALASLMQTILGMNDHAMYEHILDDDLYLGVVGMLEYDPDFPEHKANYREFLRQQTRFYSPIPIRDITIRRKIHHTYRLQFLKDVVLARTIDDSTFNVINSCIIFNQTDIINHVQQDPYFLREIVGMFIDSRLVTPAPKKPPQHQGHVPPNQIIISLNGSNEDDMEVDQKQEEPTQPTLETRQYYQTHYSWSPPDNLTEEEINVRREVVILIQQLCAMAKNIQLQSRASLFRTLVDRGILFAVQWALSLPEKEEANKSMISAAGEVLSTLMDHDLIGVRNHCMRHVDAILSERAARKKYADKAESLLELLCRLMATSRDLAIQSQVGDALKTWLELPPILEQGGGGGEAGHPKHPLRRDGGADISERFLDYFYKNCIHGLFKPLLELSEWRHVQGPILPLFQEEASRFTYLCDLLHLFIGQHQFQTHLFVISSNILSRVASLLKAKDKHLRYSAFRIFRLLLKQNNATTLNHMCKLDVFKPLLDLTLQESRRDNLLSCSCHDFFDVIRRENVKDLIKFCMTHHEAEIRQLTKTPLGSQKFELFIQRYDILCNPPPPASQERPVDPRSLPGSSRGPQLDTEEEEYWNADDDEDNVITMPSSLQKPYTLLSSVPISGIKRKRKTGISATAGGRPPTHPTQQPPSPPQRPPPRPTTGLGSLLDYDDDDDDLPSASDENKGSEGGAEDAEKQVKGPVDVSIPPTPLLAAAALPKQPPKWPQDDNDEDSGFESLASKSRSASPSSTSSSPRIGGIVLPRIAEKRRRSIEGDEEDGLMERLRKSKKVDGGPGSKEGERVPLRKVGPDPPKVIKVKLGATSLGLANAGVVKQEQGQQEHTPEPEPCTHTPLRSSTTPLAKDGDGG